MRAKLLVLPGLLMMTALGACFGDEEAANASDNAVGGTGADGPENGGTMVDPPRSDAPRSDAQPDAPAAPGAAEGSVTMADVEFAYRCRGLLSSASASSRVLPVGEAPPELSQISMRHITWWTGEASRRDSALGISKDQRRALLSATTRVRPTRESLEEALPAIRECLAQVPQ